MVNKAEGDLVMGLPNLQDKIGKCLGGVRSVHGINVTGYLVLLPRHRAVNHRMRRIELAGNVGQSASGVARLLESR